MKVLEQQPLVVCLFICFNAHFCSSIYFIASRLSISSHFVYMSVCSSAFLFVYFSPLNGSLVDLNITTGVAKFRRRKVELTVLYPPISRQSHHALTFPPPPCYILPFTVAIKNQLRWVNIKWQDCRREGRKSWKIEEFLQDKEEYIRVNVKKGTRKTIVSWGVELKCTPLP